MQILIVTLMVLCEVIFIALNTFIVGVVFCLQTLRCWILEGLTKVLEWSVK
jgi:hypothetical protein